MCPHSGGVVILRQSLGMSVSAGWSAGSFLSDLFMVLLGLVHLQLRALSGSWMGLIVADTHEPPPLVASAAYGRLRIASM